MAKVFVTGMGVVSSLGMNVSENLSALRQGVSGIAKATYFKSGYTAVLTFGEVKASNEALKERAEVDDPTGFTRTCLLACTAFKEAVSDAGLTSDELTSFDTALISASTVGGMCLTDQLYEDANLHSEGSEFLEAYGCGAHLLKLVQLHGINGFTDTINTACSSSANAILLGTRLIKSGRATRVIVGGVDSLAKYTVNGFNALKILSETNCRPFDRNRAGLNLGEASAYLVLESEAVLGTKRAYAEVAGYGNANDAYHPSAMSDEAVGPVRSMKEALDAAGIRPSQVGYINAHGTGTENNDRSELYGIRQLFDPIPPYSSTKSFTGHTLGAAGALEAVYSILAIVHSELYPSLNVIEPMDPEVPAPILAYRPNVPVSYVLSNSFGFGGNCTSLVFAHV